MQVLIKRGLKLPRTGTPVRQPVAAPNVGHVGVVAADYPGLKPSLKVSLGQRVEIGDTLIVDRTTAQLRVAASAAGIVSRIQRGERRALKSIEIALDGDQSRRFCAPDCCASANLKQQEIKDTLLASGLWSAFRCRPFDGLAMPGVSPKIICVTAMDTRPLAPDAALIMEQSRELLADGLEMVSRLARTFVCHAPDSAALLPPQTDTLSHVEFRGQHPAGLPGTHIDHLANVTMRDTVWYIDYQDVIAIGQLFRSGQLRAERVVSVAGHGIATPRLVRVPCGARLHDILGSEAAPDHVLASGSTLDGRRTTDVDGYLGRYHSQMTVGAPVAASRRSRSGLNGRWPQWLRALGAHESRAGMIPLEAFDRVWPMSAPPVPLLRALLAHDLDSAEELGVLALGEDDLALCEHVCPMHKPYRQALRQVLHSMSSER